MDRSRIWTIRELIRVTSEYLSEKGVDSPRLSAEILLAHHLKMKRIDLYLDLDRPLTDQEISGYRTLIRRRAMREPIQYITGIQEFWSLEFHVNPEVMIPRPETEILVEQAIRLLRHKGQSPESSAPILEIGTGSGIIAISIVKEIQDVLIYATDISEGALNVAMKNAIKHNLHERIRFFVGDIFEPLKQNKSVFQMILSNPPYIPTPDISSLQPEVKDYEPHVALNGGEDGLEVIKRIIGDAHLFLTHEGWLILEMDPRQMDRAVDLLEGTHMFGNYKIKKDYSNNDRVLMAQKR